MAKAETVHLASGGSIGERHMACGLRVTTEECDRGVVRSTLDPDKVTCKRCQRSRYWKKNLAWLREHAKRWR